VSLQLDGDQGQFAGYAGSSPSLSVSVSATGAFDVSNLGAEPALAYATGNATLSYSFEILGPTPTVQLQVISSGNASVSEAQSLWAEPSTSSSFSVSSGAGSQPLYLGDSASTNASTTQNVSDGFSFDQVAQFDTGTIYDVSLSVSATAGIDDGTQTSSANVDPTFQVVDVSDPNDYSIVFGPGIGNASSVPDAASAWGLLSLSLAALTGLRRMRPPIAA
jgi:hypothetical protein